MYPIFWQRVSPVGIYTYISILYIYITIYIYIHYICKITKHTGVMEMRLNLQDWGLVEFVFPPKPYETPNG